MSELKTYTTTLKNISHVSGDYYVFSVQKPKDFTWNAGQYVRVGLPTKQFEGKQLRALSMCNTVTSDVLLFATRTKQNPSNYKKALLELTVGEAVSITEPIGKFTLPEDDKPIFLVAGGIGITPLKSMLEQLASTQDQRQVTLLYATSDTYLFTQDLTDYATQLKNVSLHFVKHTNQVHTQLKKWTAEYGDNAHYLLSSSPAIVKSLTKFLIDDCHITKNSVASDILYGYDD